MSVLACHYYSLLCNCSLLVQLSQLNSTDVCIGDSYWINCTHPPFNHDVYLPVGWLRNGKQFRTNGSDKENPNTTLTRLRIHIGRREVLQSPTNYTCYIASRSNYRREFSNTILIEPLALSESCIYA